MLSQPFLDTKMRVNKSELKENSICKLCCGVHLNVTQYSIELLCILKAASYNGDLYISTDDPRPTFDHATWISADAGSEVIFFFVYSSLRKKNENNRIKSISFT